MSLPKPIAELLIEFAACDDTSDAFKEKAEEVTLCAWFHKAVGFEARYSYPACEYLDQYCASSSARMREQWSVMFAGALLRGIMVSNGKA